MAAIPSITEGMTWAQAFGIINQLIAAVNALSEAVGGALVDGSVDYNSIVNRPKINGVELVGDLTQAQLSISLDQETVERIETINERIGDVEDALGNKLNTTDLPSALSQAGFKTQTQLEEVFPLISGLASRLGILGYKTLTELGQAGYKTVTELGAAGFKTITELGQAGYKTVTEMAILGYKTTTELDSAGYYKKPTGGIPTSDMSSNLQTIVNQALGAAQTATNAASTAAALPNSNVITRVNELETAVGDNTSGMQKGVNDVKTEIGNVGVNESITKDLDMTRKFINTVVDIAIECKDDDPRRFVTTLADKTKLIVK